METKLQMMGVCPKDGILEYLEYIDEIEKLVGPPVEVTEEAIETCRANDQFGELVFDLYREAARLVCASGGTFFGYDGVEIKLDRNRAICAGLLVRISKLMLSVVKLSSGIEHGETVQVVNRCIIESMVNVRYLLLKADDEVFDKFVKNDLRAERELYDFIHDSIRTRGGEELAIEQSMLSSILAKCESSGVTIDDINSRAGSWGGSFENRVKALGFGQNEDTIFQRIPSHAVHGTWMDLLNNHLLRKEDGFEPNFDHVQTDGELLSPVGIFVVEAARDYLNKYFDLTDAKPLLERLASVQERLMRVESARQHWQTAD